MRTRLRYLGLAMWVIVVLKSPVEAGCPENFTIAIDVGHSKAAPGAMSARGRGEFWFNLELAHALADAIQGRGLAAAKVHVSSATGGAASLAKRVKDAASLHANLFVSVHHDSVQPQYLEAREFEGKRRFFSDKFSGYSLFVSRQSSQPDASLEFARRLSARLHAAGQRFSAHHAEPIDGENRPWADPDKGVYWFDGLAVLRSQKVPAVLFEAGIIVNRNDEPILASREHREKTAAAFADAVSDFCAANSVTRAPQ